MTPLCGKRAVVPGPQTATLKRSRRQERPAVDHDCLAGEIRPALAREQECHLADFRWLSQMPDRLLADNLRRASLVLPVVLAEHGLDQSRSDGVHAHAFGS